MTTLTNLIEKKKKPTVSLDVLIETRKPLLPARPFDPAEPPIAGETFRAGAIERGAVAALRNLAGPLMPKGAGLAGGAAVPSPEELKKMPWHKKIPEYTGAGLMELDKLATMHGILRGIGLIGKLPAHPGALSRAAEMAKWFGGTGTIEQLSKLGIEKVTGEDVGYEGVTSVLKSATIGAMFSFGLSGIGAVGKMLFTPSEKAMALRAFGLKRGAKEPEIRAAVVKLGERVRDGEITSKEAELLTALQKKWLSRQPDIVYRAGAKVDKLARALQQKTGVSKAVAKKAALMVHQEGKAIADVDKSIITTAKVLGDEAALGVTLPTKPKIAPAEGEVKQPWEMTKKEYLNSVKYKTKETDIDKANKKVRLALLDEYREHLKETKPEYGNIAARNLSARPLTQLHK